MAWSIELVQITRGLIGDFDESAYEYSNTRLKELVLIAAQILKGTVNFAQTYTIDVDQVTLTPDPTENTKDDAFINLVCLKAATIILMSEWKTASTKAMSFKDDASSIDARGVAEEKQALAKEMQRNFENAIKQYRAGSSAPGHAIVGPYRFEYGGNASQYSFYRYPNNDKVIT